MLKHKAILTLYLFSVLVIGSSLFGEEITDESAFNLTLRARIMGDVFTSSQIRANLSVLCNEIGGRVSGTEQGNQAQEFCLQKLSEYGLDNVRLEPFDMLGWQRISSAVAVVSPKEKALSGVALANTPSTPPEGITAEIIDVGAEGIGDRKVDWFGFRRTTEDVGGPCPEIDPWRVPYGTYLHLVDVRGNGVHRLLSDDLGPLLPIVEDDGPYLVEGCRPATDRDLLGVVGRLWKESEGTSLQMQLEACPN